ncbi:MAG: hypothetical protein CMJ54_12130 [Planctomycetaceae bacterium]|nr:hypothetical protein [Planctomycetaceae bacterium]
MIFTIRMIRMIRSTSPLHPTRTPALALFAALATSSIPIDATAQDADTAAHFGFDPLEVVPVGPNAGPLLSTDLDADGLEDLLVVNNHKSRIEFLRQRPDAVPGEPEPPRRANELPEHWRFERIEIPVNFEVGAIRAVDVDGDGMLDIVAGGRPNSIHVYRQTAPGEFELLRKNRVRGLGVSRDGLLVEDLVGTDGPLEVVGLVGGQIKIWPLERNGRLAPPKDLNAGDDRIIAIFAEDFDGNGLLDLAGIAADDEAPVRIWLASRVDAKKDFGPQLRFEMPPIAEAEGVILPGRDAARLAVIERPTKRLVVHEFRVDDEEGGEPSFEVHGFTDPGERKRDVVVADLDGDDLLDVIATDRAENAVATWMQIPGRGLGGSRTSPSFAAPDAVEAGDIDGDGTAEVFVLSEEEGVVGRATVGPDGIGFPEALRLPAGDVPVAMKLVDLEDGPALAVIASKDKRFSLDLLALDGGETQVIELGRATRGPDTVLDVDADQDGRTDLLVFTADKPMMMLRAGDDGFTLVEKDDMPQFGLVSAAGAGNTGRFDIDGDGTEELLVADRNFIRGLRYDDEKGWTVVSQLNADRDAKLVSVAILGDRIVAADREGRRLLIFERAGSGWAVSDEIAIRGIDPVRIERGGFGGSSEDDDLLLVGNDAFAVVRLDGDRPRLVETGSWRPDDNRKVPHEVGLGDLNADGRLDFVSLDAGTQMADILSFSDRGRLHPMTGFTIFETKMFSGGEPREFEPRQVLVADVTGDGADDMVLVAHDRILVYPQSVVEP